MSAGPRVPLAFFYAAMFVVVGVQLPFLPAWLATRGLSAPEIGTLLALGQWIKLATTPLAGIAADRSGEPRRVLLVLGGGALAGYVLLLSAVGFARLFLFTAATLGCLAAMLPLAEKMALEAAYAGKLEYGHVRLWGSIAFIASSLLAGKVLAGGDYDIVIYLLIGAALLLLVASLALPQGDALFSTRRADWRLFARPRFIVFLLAATLVQGSHSVLFGFGTLYWQGLGHSDETIAVLWSESVVAEIILFFWSAPLLRRADPLALIVLSGGAGVLRWTGTTFATGLPALALLQLLHAFTFAAAHLGAMHYLARTLPPEQAATAQSLYAVVVGGIGAGLLMLAAGALYGAVGVRAYLAMAACAGAGGLAALAIRPAGAVRW